MCISLSLPLPLSLYITPQLARNNILYPNQSFGPLATPSAILPPPRASIAASWRPPRLPQAETNAAPPVACAAPGALAPLQSPCALCKDGRVRVRARMAE